MSNVSNRHNVLPFVAGKSVALTGQRLAKVGYKSSKTTPAKFPSICVSVPPVDSADITANIDHLTHIWNETVSNAQDGIIRSLYESSDGTLTSVSDDDISIAAVINYLEAESTGGRLTKEFLESWFDANVSENLTFIIADKLGFAELNDEQMIVIQKHLNMYRGLIASLSGGKTILQTMQINACIRALEVSMCDDDIKNKLITRLDKMSQAPKIEELLEL